MKLIDECAACGGPTTGAVIFETDAHSHRVACCETCQANARGLNYDLMMVLLMAARDQQLDAPTQESLH